MQMKKKSEKYRMKSAKQVKILKNKLIDVSDEYTQNFD